jgi:hypothetical protein
VRERRNDILHQISHLLTAKAGVIKFEALNIKGMMRNPNLGLSVADAAMFRQDALPVQGRLARETDREDRSVVPVHSGLLSMRMHQYRHEEAQSTRTPAPSAGMSKVGTAMQHATPTGTARNAGTVSAKIRRAGISQSRGTASGLAPGPIVETRIETHGGPNSAKVLNVSPAVPRPETASSWAAAEI